MEAGMKPSRGPAGASHCPVAGRFRPTYLDGDTEQRSDFKPSRRRFGCCSVTVGDDAGRATRQGNLTMRQSTRSTPLQRQPLLTASGIFRRTGVVQVIACRRSLYDPIQTFSAPYQPAQGINDQCQFLLPGSSF
jgi:hypothetical protein